MSEQLTDQVLVERVQKGDQKAFNLLVVRYQHKVASLVSRYVPPGDIADVVQESFVKAWRALDSFRGDSAFLHLVIPYRRQHGEELSGCSGAPSAVQRC
ncbi:RNA polymerase sigma factor RpoE [Klebsiella pneumoniae]|uniref:RNA polymerase sigma factor RpoE n=1 Tax=Klebsiella pneumoniae TaxID=573 RepID=A0A3S4HQZ2_KLEPN|nr:RNA polymerase sigma factor RpoE [Klebsiella pneumoniae]